MRRSFKKTSPKSTSKKGIQNSLNESRDKKYKTTGVSFHPDIYYRLKEIAHRRQMRTRKGRASVSKIIEDLVMERIEDLEREEGIK